MPIEGDDVKRLYSMMKKDVEPGSLPSLCLDLV